MSARLAIIGLSVMASLQIAAKAYPSEVAMAAGTDTTVHAEALWKELGAPRDGVLVLAFHPQCAFSDVVAHDWAAWLGDLSAGAKSIVGLTLVGQAEAEDHLAQMGWELAVVTAATGAGRALASRTPWIYLIDGHGRLAFEGHGQRWGEAERVIASWGPP